MRETSIEAKESIKESVPSLREIVLKEVKIYGEFGLTCDEAEKRLGLRHQTASARFTELVKDDLIEDKGLRRKTSSGRNAIAWVAKT